MQIYISLIYNHLHFIDSPYTLIDIMDRSILKIFWGIALNIPPTS